MLVASEGLLLRSPGVEPTMRNRVQAGGPAAGDCGTPTIPARSRGADAAGGRTGRRALPAAALAAFFGLTALAWGQDSVDGVFRVAYRDVDRVATAEGVVEAVRQSTIAAQVQGRIVEFSVKAGDTVRAGQVIARIDARTAEQSVASSRAQVAEARANLTNARVHYERTRQLLAQKFVSQAALDQAETEYKAAQAQVAAVEAAAQQAVTVRSFTAISAPYTGVVATTHVELGDMATPGRPLVTVFEPGKLRVTATVPQAMLAAVDPEAPVRLEIPAVQKTITATAVTVLPVADARTHTTKIRLELPGADELLPGQFARAYFVTGRARKLVVPQSAVLKRSEVTAVYVLPDGRPAQLRQVRLGERVGDGLVEILAGVREGELIAVDPVGTGSRVPLASRAP